MRDEDLYTTIVDTTFPVIGSTIKYPKIQRNIGSLVSLDLDNIVNSTGGRGGVAGGIITSLTRDFNSRTTVVEIMILTIAFSDGEKRWTASGQVDSATSTTIDLVPNFYIPVTTALGDAQGFRATDRVVLLSEFFEVKSLVAQIQSVATDQIVLAASFIAADSSGPITAAAGDIIIHAPLDEQPVVPTIRASSLANFSEITPTEDYFTTRYEP
jgi:hypothetical protein